MNLFSNESHRLMSCLFIKLSLFVHPFFGNTKFQSGKMLRSVSEFEFDKSCIRKRLRYKIRTKNKKDFNPWNRLANDDVYRITHS